MSGDNRAVELEWEIRKNERDANWDEIFDSLAVDFKSPWKAVAIGILLRAVIDWRAIDQSLIHRFAKEKGFTNSGAELHTFMKSEWCQDLFDMADCVSYDVAMRAIGLGGQK